MISNENLKYAVQNLKNRKMRSLLTVTSIFVGISTIFIFISFGLGLYQYINDIQNEIGADKLIVQVAGIGAPGTDDSFKLEDSDIKALERTRGITQAAGMPFSAAAVNKDGVTKYLFVIGLPTKDKEDYDLVIEYFTFDVDQGRALEDGDDSRVVLGYRYSIPNGIFEKPLEVGDKININDFDFKIVGFFEEIGNPSDDGNIYVTFDAYKKITGRDDINYAMLVARVDDITKIDEIKDRAEKELRKSRDQEEGKEDFFIQSAKELIESFQGALNIVIGFIIVIALISVVVSAINTANTMFTSILERTKEIGVLKAIGAQNKEILILFLLESSILGLLAGIIGVIVGAALSSLGGVILENLGWGFLQPSYNWILIVGCILFSTAVGTFSGLLPAYGASRQNPVDSLRYE